jgi:3',5'-cyclic AMP phosphodiesterase CpdA
MYKGKYVLILMLLCSYTTMGQRLVNMNNGKFKIVQFTDIHYMATNPAAKESIKLIKEVLAAEKPDLVAFTGDIVTMNPCFEGWDDILNAVEKFNTPWAVVFGNHDDEHDKTRDEIMEYITKRKYSLASKGDSNIKGVGNYIIEVSDGTNTNFLLYFMDSNTYSAIKGIDGYGWFERDQIEWYRKNSVEYTKKNGEPIPALAFFHIPLNEYENMTSARKKIVGMKNEQECPGAINSGMFLAMRECGDIMATFAGHDHDNDYIGKYNGIFLAYGRFTGSTTTYTHMTHGARIIELTAGEKDFKTWIRLKDNQIINTVNSKDFNTKK